MNQQKSISKQRTAGAAGLPTATVHESRLRLFQATRRPKMIETFQETSWGRVRIRGKLGQQHADLLESIRHCAEAQMIDQIGRIKLLVDPARVRKITGQEGATLQRDLDDLLSVVIEILEPEHLRCVGHLIDHVGKAQRGDGTYVTRSNPLGGRGGQRYLWRVTIGEAAMHMLAADLRIDYDPEAMAKIDHGVTAAVVRLARTHRDEPAGGWTLDGLIMAVAGNLSDQALRDRRRELRADAQVLESMGLRLDGDRLRRL